MKKEVVVALVVVEFCAVKFWRVEEPVRRRFENLVRPAVAVTVPVKFEAGPIVWPFMRPEVMAVAKRLVVEAVVAKKFVVVAFVVIKDIPVAFWNVKFWRVVEPAKKRSPEEESERSAAPEEDAMSNKSAVCPETALRLKVTMLGVPDWFWI